MRPVQAPERAAPDYRLEIARDAKLALQVDIHANSRILESYAQAGRGMQCNSASPEDERQIVIGLDFGTSSTKVVIGDSALNKAFAVPFTHESGIERYLLPSCLHEMDGKFSLLGGQFVYRDLKLFLLADPFERQRQDRVIAFLALVIRHARGWLFSEQREIYSNTRIVWKLVIGLPVAPAFDQRLSRVFIKLGKIAWLVAGGDGDVSVSSIQAARAKVRIAGMSPDSQPDTEDLEVEGVSELAAQIYGFVKSNQFDKRAHNIFLLVDVGAGTVDSSLFHVKPAHGGRWDFDIFNSVVEPHGVMNLHRHRMAWWRHALRACPDPGSGGLSRALDGIEMPTDRMVPLPESFSQYFEGVSVQFADNSQSPDEIFFSAKVVRQVRGDTCWRAANENILPKESLKQISAFYCGGGARMKFYDRLREELRTFPGVTWLSAVPRQIEVPSNLEAPSLRRADYDRLSVAYGLSFLEVGKIARY